MSRNDRIESFIGRNHEIRAQKSWFEAKVNGPPTLVKFDIMYTVWYLMHFSMQGHILVVVKMKNLDIWISATHAKH